MAVMSEAAKDNLPFMLLETHSFRILCKVRIRWQYGITTSAVKSLRQLQNLHLLFLHFVWSKVCVGVTSG